MKFYNSVNDKALIEDIKSGLVGVIPTDTVYGLVALASNKEAVNRLYNLKSRENKPGTIIASSVDQIVNLGVKRRYLKAVEQFWPNPVSVEIPHHIDYLNQGTGRQAFRIPADKSLLKLLEQVGALQTTSANSPGEPPANTIEEAQGYFGDKVDFYVDGGDLSDREPSTILKIVDDAIEIIREGAFKIRV